MKAPYLFDSPLSVFLNSGLLSMIAGLVAICCAVGTVVFLCKKRPANYFKRLMIVAVAMSLLGLAGAFLGLGNTFWTYRAYCPSSWDTDWLAMPLGFTFSWIFGFLFSTPLFWINSIIYLIKADSIQRKLTRYYIAGIGTVLSCGLISSLYLHRGFYRWLTAPAKWSQEYTGNLFADLSKGCFGLFAGILLGSLFIGIQMLVNRRMPFDHQR